MKTDSPQLPSAFGNSSLRHWWMLVILLSVGGRCLFAQQAVSVPRTGVTSFDSYRTARTPTVTVKLAPSAQGRLKTRLSQMNALADADPAPPMQPQSRGGVFDEVNLGYLDGSGNPPAPVSVVLQFGAASAGASVWVQPLDGGTILTQDADGNPVSNPAGYAATLDATGQLTFSYQALPLSGRYQVLILLGNVSSILPFIIPDPSQDN